MQNAFYHKKNTKARIFEEIPPKYVSKKEAADFSAASCYVFYY
jgi:hypothetical protein